MNDPDQTSAIASLLTTVAVLSALALRKLRDPPTVRDRKSSSEDAKSARSQVLDDVKHFAEDFERLSYAELLSDLPSVRGLRNHLRQAAQHADDWVCALEELVR